MRKVNKMLVLFKKMQSVELQKTHRKLLWFTGNLQGNVDCRTKIQKL